MMIVLLGTLAKLLIVGTSLTVFGWAYHLGMDLPSWLSGLMR